MRNYSNTSYSIIFIMEIKERERYRDGKGVRENDRERKRGRKRGREGWREI